MVISANVDAAARQMKDQPILQRKLLSALVASDQAAKLIARSTSFARQSEAGFQYLDLAEPVSAIADLMSRSLLRDTVELRLALADDLWAVQANPDDIQTALVTLSAHVRDALPQGGAITLEARNVQVPRGLWQTWRSRAISFSSPSAAPDRTGRLKPTRRTGRKLTARKRTVGRFTGSRPLPCGIWTSRHG
ncbi:hypothetical protein ACFQY9_25490 [Microvirga aerilata]|uniref:hypothetical protein n=1 Tax=Microvirga aerilata TaxID=670292 RepID=UPI0036360DF2